MVRHATSAVLVLLGTGPAAWAQVPADSGAVHDRFAVATTAQLDSLYGPLLYLMQPDERGIYPTLTPSGKRDYLRRFWSRREPTAAASSSGSGPPTKCSADRSRRDRYPMRCGSTPVSGSSSTASSTSPASATTSSSGPTTGGSRASPTGGSSLDTRHTKRW